MLVVERYSKYYQDDFGKSGVWGDLETARHWDNNDTSVAEIASAYEDARVFEVQKPKLVELGRVWPKWAIKQIRHWISQLGDDDLTKNVITNTGFCAVELSINNLFVGTGMSKCHWRDSLDPALGFDIAYGRAELDLALSILRFYKGYMADIENFLTKENSEPEVLEFVGTDVGDFFTGGRFE